MLDVIERFFNWQMDLDLLWGPLLFLRPPKTQRLTLLWWLKYIAVGVALSVTLGIPAGLLLVYYDYATAQTHQPKAPPVAAIEKWIMKTPPATVLTVMASLIVGGILFCFPTHWAWNRRADRLNREAALPPPVPVAVPGVWPPPPMPSASSPTAPKI